MRADRLVMLALLTGALAWSTPRAQVQNSAAMFGAVRDADGAPIGGAILTLAGTELPRAKSTVSDVDGMFTFAGLPAGRYTLTASKPPYLTMAFGATRPGRQGIALTLTAGESLNQVKVRLVRGAVLTGTLRDERGGSVADATVLAMRMSASGAAVAAAGASGPVVTTDDRGVYRIYGLLPGDYVIAAAIDLPGQGAMTMPSTEEIDRRLAELQRGSPPAAAVPAAGRATTAAPAPQPPGFGIAPTFYPGTTSAADAARVTVASDEERVADFVLTPVRVSAMSGQIRMADGSPLPAVVLALDTEMPQMPVTFGGVRAAATVRPSAADGRFMLTGVPPGRYVLRARSQPGRGTPMTAGMSWGRAEVMMTGGDVTGVDVALRPGLRVTGRVLFDSTSIAPPADLTKLRVTLTAAGAPATSTIYNGGMNRDTTVSAFANANGTFTVPDVVPGIYTITVAAPSSWFLRSAIAGGRDAIDGPVEIRDADLGGVVVTLSDRRAELSGLLQTPASAPAIDYTVVLFPADKTLWRPGARRVRAIRPANDGRFIAGDLPAGEYLVAALTDVEPDDLADPAFLAGLVPAAVKVTLADGEKKTQDLRIVR